MTEQKKTEHRGIGEDGKTLKQMLEENEKRYEQTGCYDGITEPHVCMNVFQPVLP